MAHPGFGHLWQQAEMSDMDIAVICAQDEGFEDGEPLGAQEVYRFKCSQSGLSGLRIVQCWCAPDGKLLICSRIRPPIGVATSCVRANLCRYCDGQHRHSHETAVSRVTGQPRQAPSDRQSSRSLSPCQIPATCQQQWQCLQGCILCSPGQLCWLT
jgi:hypothetical protein